MADSNLILRRASQTSGCDSNSDDIELDFVFVEKELKSKTSYKIDDEHSSSSSYDYCDDFTSSLCNGDEQENGDDVYLLSDSIEAGTTSPAKTFKDSALTVPLVLLKDLDEAHEAAKLIKISVVEGLTDLVTTCSDDELCVEAEQNDDSSLLSTQNSLSKEPEQVNREEFRKCSFMSRDDNTDCSKIEGSSSSQIFKESNEAYTATVNGNSSRAILILPVNNNPTAKEITRATKCFLFANHPQQEVIQSEENDSCGDKNNTNNNHVNEATFVPVPTSRTSNKKRRKKLKLLKKKQAAEKFQQQNENLSTHSQGKVSKKFLKQSKKQHHVMPLRCASKKVANIAVSCAIQSMASYREELARPKGK